jgi:N-acetyl-alpha-D-glucosaminyl L-malate synthase BshA
VKIGMVCYASVGGSGIVATELGAQLARRGHEVHFVTNDVPVRLNRFAQNVFFHRVQIDPYPVFAYTPYSLNLAAKLLEVCHGYDLDLVHAHYAVPHATSTYLARQMLRPQEIRTVTTLHGTDITLVGRMPSYYEVTRFSIEESDRVTAVSEWLRAKTYESFATKKEITVVRNFVDTERYRPLAAQKERAGFAKEGEFVVMHASNFRPVKNVPTVLRVTAEVNRRFPVKLLLVGDGPELAAAKDLAHELGLTRVVHFLGSQEYIEDLLPLADLFLLPSEHESFGLTALEAMSAGVAVVATNNGGTSEIIRHGENGFLHDPRDVSGMTETIGDLFANPARLEAIEREGRRTAVEEFEVAGAVDRYMKVYEEALR